MNKQPRSGLIRNLLIFLALTALFTFAGEDLLVLIFDNWIPAVIVLAGVVILAIIKGKTSLGKGLRTGAVLTVTALIASVGVMMLLSSLGIQREFRITDQFTAQEAGTTSTILNNGVKAETASHLFYLPPATGQPTMDQAMPLWRRDRDWTDPIQLTQTPVSWFMVNQNFVYYVSPRENYQLFRMDHDGKNPQSVIDQRVERFVLQGDILLYNTFEALYQSELDGTNRVKLSETGAWPTALRPDGWLYYQPTVHRLARVRAGGTEEVLIPQLDGLTLADDAIYFFKLSPAAQNEAADLEIYRQAYTGGDAVQTTVVENVHFAKYDAGKLYYQRGTDKGRIDRGIYRAGPDGSSPEKINKLSVWQFEDLLGDWVYFLQYSGKHYRVHLDGTVGVEVK